MWCCISKRDIAAMPPSNPPISDQLHNIYIESCRSNNLVNKEKDKELWMFQIMEHIKGRVVVEFFNFHCRSS